MPYEEELVGKFWLDLMTAASMYNENKTLKNIIIYHKAYMDELTNIIHHFTECDFIKGWVDEYEGSLDLLLDSIE